MTPNRTVRNRPARLLLVCLLLPLSLWAQQSQQRPAFLGQDLAVEIEADEAELSELRDTSIYRGNVRLTRGPLSMQGDQLKIHRDADTGRITATLSGQPATATHRTPEDELPVTASARRIVYITQVEILELDGNARIQRGADELQGDSVRYDVANARIQADGGERRVRIVINPPGKTAEDKTTP